jgi:hypothetical protein
MQEAIYRHKITVGAIAFGKNLRQGDFAYYLEEGMELR